MPAIFISHSSRDASVADEFKTTLTRLGFERVFLDFDKDTGIGAGENWEKRLYEELSRCHAVILALTPNWMASKWCFAELQQARALGKVIFPIVCEPLGDGRVLTEIQAVDLLDWKSGGIDRLQQRLQAISTELARGFSLDPDRSPYPGIHAFEAEDAAIYFGRDQETRAVIEKLDARRRQGGARFLVIIGASGSGKSSLLKAGVLPQLTRRRNQWIALPPMRPEKAPLEAFSKALAEMCGEPQAWRPWHEKLQGPDAVRNFTDLLKDLRVGETKAATLLLPVDQFEEVFTISDAKERTAYLSLLAAILDPALDLPVLAVATGRADVLQGLLEGSEIAQITETIPLGKMPLDRVPRLIEGPAAVAGLLIEKGLSERITRDVESPEALPLLAYTLRVLYERGGGDKRLTSAEYTALGDPTRGLNPVQNSVRLAADQAVEGLKPTEQELSALRDAFVPHLVRLRIDDGKRVRQPAPLSALPREAERLIRALTEARLLTVRTDEATSGNGARPRDGIVEVTHEALFEAWPTLAGWLDQEQVFLTDIERIKSAQQTWAQTPDEQKDKARLQGLLLSRARDWLVKYPQRFLGSDMEPMRAFIEASAKAEDAELARAHRLRRRFVQAVASAAIIFAVAAVVAGWQYFEADRARGEAVAQRNRAEQNFGIAKRAADNVVFNIAQSLRTVQGMRVTTVRRILDAAKVMMDELVRASPEDHELQRSLYAMLFEFATTYQAAGDLPRARTAAEESLAIMRKLAAVDPNNRGWQRDLSVSLNKVADIRVANGDSVGSLTAYMEGLAIVRVLAAADPNNTGWRRDVYVSLIKIGDVKLASGDRTGALAAFEEGLSIVEAIAKTDEKNNAYQRDVSINLVKIGDVRLAAGDRKGALEAYEQSLEIVRKLAAADPNNVEWVRDVYVSLVNAGDVRLAGGDRDGALERFNEALEIMRRLSAADPGNAPWQRDVSVCLNKIGDARVAAGDRPGAITAYNEALTIVRKLAATDQSNTGWQRDVYVSLVKIGDVRMPAGERTQALKEFDEALAIMRKLAASDPGNALWQRDLSVSLDKAGDARLPAGDRKGAADVYEESLAIRRKLAAADLGHVGWQLDLVVSLSKVGGVYDPARARAALNEGKSILLGLDTQGKLTPTHQGWIKWFDETMAKLPPAGG